MDNGKKSIAGRLTFGMLIICIGITLLLNNTGYISWDVWNDLISYWPVLLIIAGINVIFERSAGRPLTYLSPFIIAGMFAFVIMNYDPSRDTTGHNAKPDLFSVNTKNQTTFKVTGYKPEDVETVKLEVNGGAGTIEVEGWDGYAAGDVISVDAETTGFVPKLNEKLNDGVLKIELSDENTGVFRNRGHEYSIKLTPEYVYDLIINTGAGDLTFDLSDHEVENLEVNTGAAEVNLITPSSGSSSCKVEINSGASDISVEVPVGVRVKVTKNGLGSVESDDLEVSGDAYSNLNADGDAPFEVNLEVNNAVGAISLKPYDESGSDSGTTDESVVTDGEAGNTEDITTSEADGTSTNPDETEGKDSTGENSNDNENPSPAWYDSLTRLH